MRTAPVAATVPVATPASTPTQIAQSQLAALSKAVAADAPVDTDRVDRIKAALANGTFPILPATIADQMLSFRYEWMSDDPKSQD
ncbi:flagellar biosynthesis anti-sigma factor FlgM [uncultured Sphingomonas sp.]|uniref:flagellar biosynthesis anti-sigma factor FlgM n=1 Tax=uncultured Sphingomonas sp. TaxID=158754 RepID=UPI0035CA43B1